MCYRSISSQVGGDNDLLKDACSIVATPVRRIYRECVTTDDAHTLLWDVVDEMEYGKSTAIFLNEPNGLLHLGRRSRRRKLPRTRVNDTSLLFISRFCKLARLILVDR